MVKKVKTGTKEAAAESVKKFRRLWDASMEGMRDAAEIYVSAIDSYDEAKAMFADEIPEISPAVWSRIEKIGRGQIHYMLLCDSSPASDALRALPYSEQERIIEGTVPVLTDKGDVLNVKAKNLTEDMVRQAISSSGIRDIAGQRAYMESQKVVNKRKQPSSEMLRDIWFYNKRTCKIEIPPQDYTVELDATTIKLMYEAMQKAGKL